MASLLLLGRRFGRRSLCHDALSRFGKSPLFVVGDKSVESVVVPDIDIRARCERSDQVERNLTARRWRQTFDLEKIRKGADYLEWIEREQKRLEEEQGELRERLKPLIEREKKGELGEDEKKLTEKLKERARESRKSLKDVKSNRWELEDSVVLPFLDLPNVLHDDCPLEVDKELFSIGQKPIFPFPAKNHLEIVPSEIEMSCNSHTAFYLMGRAARLELELTRRVQNHLIDSGLSMLSCPDLVKSLLVEGCGVDFADVDAEFALRETRDFCKGRETGQAMHLVGAASLYPFVALFCKSVVLKPQVLPQSFFCVGRRYSPISNHAEKKDLFSTQQSTCVKCFSVSAFEGLGKQEFDATIDIIKNFYVGLGLHFRLTVRAAHVLTAAECYRVAVEMMSASRNDYVEVGHLSMYGDYLSKRMMLKAEDRGGLLNLKVVAGTVMDVTKVIACIVESAQNL